MPHEEMSCALRRAVIALWRLGVALEAEDMLSLEDSREEQPC